MALAVDFSKVHLRRIALDDPQILQWWDKFRQNHEGFGYYANPQIWMGMYDGERLLSAYGGYLEGDGTCIVCAAVCEPSRFGLAALALLGIMLKGVAKNRPIRFFVESSNRRMKYITEKILGARTIAEMKEL